MKIDQLLDLINGELLTASFISYFENFIDDPHKAQRGDLFFAKTAKDIDIAISNGVYGVVFDFDVEIKDEECAYIKVSSMFMAQFSLIRYFVTTSYVKLYFIEKNMFHIASSINRDKRVQFFEKNTIFETLNAFKTLTIEYIFICDEYLQDLISYKYQKITTTNIFVKIKETTFFSTIANDDIFFELDLSPFHFEDFATVFSFFLTNDLNHSILNINTYSFCPIYIDRKFKECKYGKGDRVIIFDPSQKEIVEKSTTFIHQKSKWAKIKHYSKLDLDLKYCEVVSNENELIQKAKKDEFNYLHLIGYEVEKIKNLLQENPTQSQTLFDL